MDWRNGKLVPASDPREGIPVSLNLVAQRNAADRYLEERVATASPAQLTGMLFDAAVAALTRAEGLQRTGNYNEACAPLIKAQDIVLELRCALNAEAGELATALDALYAYAHQRLVHANVKRDDAAITEVIGIIDPLRIAWRESCLRVAAAG